jgi:hypothetical protein
VAIFKNEQIYPFLKGDLYMHERELTDLEGYELFRRAIVEREDEAWTAIHRHFRPLLVAWARQASSRAPAAEQHEDIADRALARAWSVLGPEQFAQFPSLAALLAYLRACVGAAALNEARAAATRERAYQKLAPPVVATPEDLVLGALERKEIWLLINKLISSEQERIILIESFMLGLPPRAILERHQDRFADVPEIYGTKRNLLNRLERSRDLRQIYHDQYEYSPSIPSPRIRPERDALNDSPTNSFRIRQTERVSLQTSFIGRWLDQKDAIIEFNATEATQARRSYGQQLLVQQWKLDISNDHITKETGIDTETILLLQLGLAHETSAAPNQWDRLAKLLADNENGYIHVKTIIYLALGDQKSADGEPNRIMKPPSA